MRSGPERKLISKLVLDRFALLELFMVGVLLAVGLSLISSMLVFESNLVTLAAAVTILLIVFIWYAVSRLRGARQDLHAEGFVIYDPIFRDLIDVESYDLTEKIGRYARAVFSERPEIYSLWLNHPIHEIRKYDRAEGPLQVNYNESFRLMHELLEYYVLDELSLHLSSYFNDSDFEKSRLSTITYEHLPRELARNRVLVTFSTPPHLRPWRRGSTEPLPDNVVYATGSGYEFSRFELTLPQASSVQRVFGGALLIQNRDISLKIKVDFPALNTLVPPQFLEHYVGISRSDGIPVGVFEVNLVANARLKWRAAFALRGWRYQAWVEAFLTRLENEWSRTIFLNEIGWKTAQTMLRVNGVPPRIDSGKNWGVQSFIPLSGTIESSLAGETLRQLANSLADVLAGDEKADFRVEEALTVIRQEEPASQLPQLVKQLLAGNVNEHSIAEFDRAVAQPHFSLAEEVDFRRRQREANNLILVVTAIAAARGDNHAVNDLKHLLDQQDSPSLVEAIRSIVNGEPIDLPETQLREGEKRVLFAIQTGLEVPSGQIHPAISGLVSVESV